MNYHCRYLRYKDVRMKAADFHYWEVNKIKKYFVKDFNLTFYS